MHFLHWTQREGIMTNFVGGGFPVIQGLKWWNYMEIYIFIKLNHGVSRTSPLHRSWGKIIIKVMYLNFLKKMIIHSWKITFSTTALNEGKTFTVSCHSNWAGRGLLPGAAGKEPVLWTVVYYLSSAAANRVAFSPSIWINSGRAPVWSAMPQKVRDKASKERSHQALR